MLANVPSLCTVLYVHAIVRSPITANMENTQKYE